MDWWENNNADSIESNWLERKHLITIEKDSFCFHYPDTLTLIEKGEFIFPRKHYLSSRDYEDSYLSDLELIIMSRTLYMQGIRKLYDVDEDFVRLLSFKEKNPIITEYFLDTKLINYTITNGFSWTHGEVIKFGQFDISSKQAKRIKNELCSWIDKNMDIYRSSELTDFVIEFKLDNEYVLIKLSRNDYKNKTNKPFIKLIKEFEKITSKSLLEKRN
ncbi:hypothetical protein DWB61_17465 [Ancylomarina euxinus]|uniref:Uncharacterized protein n=1 Tax=Ancylomarina euxinus TaxID=2283627 RepID=A0A425XWF6_9BACT|nr:hypothetical protein [Ancylomarina euxinus]MCZ4696451.1 hypothetical protein [Ancylomarina euxinus]RRG18976.1 hypothetical protein DWB61_17465 [Ancylomarina euxinus]